ncbi:diguanylate cyclase (GGDEF)-like protein [Actinoplanes octamycinicus]|uniref:Diguanylate cyclase (GGDEF)-like protein n=1 Tax=Actinoplanes octamycinicus TaxID=135948 RepID=A0A7W7H3E7_9ACTN|nr:EAL domain-containing protein [Actinoplanes octamycinicus]MBB4743270.1 diguanylate cyclase (GGDEF)-like protein [Actinoplanes octamycinicus]GIE63857.1 hypothetical protein Aoc01nite_92590 [Actinoplanes octamycinicus]
MRLLPVRASLSVAAFAVTVFALNLTAPRGPEVLLWLGPCGAVLVPLVSAWRVARMPDLPAPTRRFWRTLAVCLVMAGCGAAAHGYDTIHSPSLGRHMSIGTISLYGLTMLLLLWSLIRLPMGTSGRGDVLRIALDAGTVMIAGAAFLWHFEARPQLEAAGYRPATLLAMTVTLLLELVTVFAIMKVALAGQAYIAPGALRLLAGALLVGALSSLLQGLIEDRRHLDMVQLTLPAILVCVTAAAERQRKVGVTRATREKAGRSPFSRLPYLAVAGVDLLLLISVRSGADLLPTVIAVIALTGLVMWRQVTAFRENAELLSRLDHSATHDALTQLPNRALFTERLAATLAAGGPCRGIGVALIDLDDFKIVNDTLGHQAGDVLLVAVAQRLRACLRPGDTAARLGGDEFVVLLEDVTPDEAEGVMRRMIDVLTEPVLADGQHLLVRASIGIAGGRLGEEPDEVLRRADIAMYAAKHGGGGAVQRYRPGMAGAVAGSAALGAELQQALAAGELFLEYQPIVSLSDRRIIGAEALMRWSHPVRGRIAPAEFIPVAERTGLIVTIGAWALHEACRQFAAWRQEHGADAPGTLSVNVSPRQLADPDLVAHVRAALAGAGLPADCLTLDLTGTAEADLTEAAQRLRELRDLGVRVALDDFGTGQASLTLLHRLPVDQLKLDRAFLDPADGTGVPMPSAVLALARAAGLEVVAEGVETADEAAALAACGYRMAQGFHLGPPMPGAELGQRLSSHQTAVTS